MCYLLSSNKLNPFNSVVEFVRFVRCAPNLKRNVIEPPYQLYCLLQFERDRVKDVGNSLFVKIWHGSMSTTHQMKTILRLALIIYTLLHHLTTSTSSYHNLHSPKTHQNQQLLNKQDDDTLSDAVTIYSSCTDITRDGLYYIKPLPVLYIKLSVFNFKF